MKRMHTDREIRALAVDSVENKAVLNVQSLNVKGDFIKDMSVSDSWLNGLAASNKYAKIMVKNGVLYMVLSLRVTNNTESSITTGATAICGIEDLADEIASKIYRKDGTDLTKAPIDSDDVSGCIMQVTSTTSGASQVKPCNIYSGSKKHIKIWSSSPTQFTVSAGDRYDVDIRTFLIL